MTSTPHDRTGTDDADADTTSTPSPGELARATFKTLFEDRDPEAARRFWDEDSVDHFLAQGFSARGPDELAAFFHELLAAMPDLRMEILELTETSSESIVQWRMTGTFDGGPFIGIEPTGKRIEMRGCDCFRWTDRGTIDTNTVYSDGAEFARQIGMLPARDSAADRAMLKAFNAGQGLRRRLGR
ncbi:SnoaL-like domain-containing protein [Thermoleophilia bacterium SCSIO 60948]|nr:SnoaL-like domain-containing protein [Thermoleophilia bacterium SCSIO 60948]